MPLLMLKPSLLLISAELLVVLPTQAQQRSPSPEQQEVFALLAPFDPVDTSKLPFVEFCTGEWSGTPPQNDYQHGFLLASDGHSFRVLTVDLQVLVLQNTPTDRQECERCRFVPADLGGFADDLATRIREAKNRPDEWQFHADRKSPCLPSVALLVAHACARAGLQAQVDALWAVLPRGWRTREQLCAEHGPADLDTDLEQFLIRDFGDPSLDWRDLLARHRQWLASFSRHRRAADVRQRVEALAELASRPAAAPRTDDSLDALIRGLSSTFRPALQGTFEVYPLQPDQPPPAAANSCFERLVARGLEAVPALFDALDDAAPTRSVLLDGGRYQVRRRGQIANDVLQEITGLPLYYPSDWQPLLSRVRDLGVDRCLLDYLQHGKNLRYRAARQWLRHHADDPAPVLAAADHDAAEGHLLLEELVRSPAAADPRVRAALRAAARTDAARLWAQRSLLRLGDAALIDDALAAWQHGQAPEPDELGLLLQAGRRDLLLALRQRFADDAVRGLFASALQQLDPTALRPPPTVVDQAAYLDSLRQLLLDLLADSQPFGNDVALLRAGRIVRAQSATRADVAAAAMAGLWPEVFAFDPSLPPAARAQRIAAMATNR